MRVKNYAADADFFIRAIRVIRGLHSARTTGDNSMKAYLITTGTVFGLITVAHIARFFAEGSRLLTEPLFLLLTALAAGLCAWAWTLLKRLARP
jgi:hypothetical protein